MISYGIKIQKLKNSCDKEVYRRRTEYDKTKCLCKCFKIYMDKKAFF